MYIVHKKIFTKRLVGLAGVTGIIIMSAYGSFQSYKVLSDYYKPYYLKSYVAAAGLVARNALSQAATAVAATGEGTKSVPPKGEAMAIPVLLYHGILNKTDGINVSLQNFTDQMTTLKKAGYRTVSVEDLHAFLKAEKTLPEKSFLITFDDGRKDSYYPTDPLLRALGYKAVMFAIENYSEKEEGNYYLTEGELKGMVKGGRWQIESHSNTHRDLTSIPRIDLYDEIGKSKIGLEKIIGAPIIAFAFPFGEFGQEENDHPEISDESKRLIMELAKEYYQMSFFQFFTPERFTQNYQNPAEAKNNYLVKRIGVQPLWSGADLRSALRAGAPKLLPFEANFNEDEGWVNTLWGDMNLEDGLIVKAAPESTGSAVILDGSRLWGNYELEAKIRWPAGSNIYIWARYQNDYNYVACNFGQTLAHVEETFEGKTNVIRGDALPIPEAEKREGLTVGVQVNGRDVSCLMNGRVVVATNYLNEKLDKGGIGFKSWDQKQGISAMQIDKLTVKPITNAGITP